MTNANRPRSLVRRLLLIESADFHCLANSVKHEPRALLLDAKSPCEFVATDAVFHIGDAPHSNQPLVQAERGVLENGSHFVRKLFAAILATEHVAGFYFADPLALGFTVRADDRAAWPLDPLHVLVAHVQVGEVADGFKQGCGEIVNLSSLGTIRSD